jgi:hypothetical protein
LINVSGIESKLESAKKIESRDEVIIFGGEARIWTISRFGSFLS